MIPIDTEALSSIQDMNTMYLARIGSHAYGTATPESDEDLRGVFKVPLSRMIDGFPTDKTQTTQSGKLDIVLYPHHKFLKLCAQSNPNILDWLFLPDDCVLFCRDDFRKIILNRKRFLTKQLHPRFKGYAMGHLQKMQRGVTPHLGDKRKKDVKEHGYSTKNAMHLIRLARMGCEALETGEYIVRRPDAEELLAIRRGEWTLQKVLDEGYRLMERMDRSVEKSSLPESVDMAWVVTHLVVA